MSLSAAAQDNAIYFPLIMLLHQLHVLPSFGGFGAPCAEKYAVQRVSLRATTRVVAESVGAVKHEHTQKRA